MRDPVGFATQELRRKNYFEMKQMGNVTKASVAMSVLQCNMLIDSENEMFYDDPYDIDDPTVSWSLGQGDESAARQVAVAAVPTC